MEDNELAAFCEHAHPRLVGALGLYCGDRHLAEELAQEALLKLCRRWARVRALESPVGWAYRVGVNLANSRFRRRAAERRAYARLPQHDEAAPVEDPAMSTDVLALHEVLRHLPEKQRDALILRFFLDLSAEQTAQALGTSPGAVRALTHRAISVLRERMTMDLEIHEEVSDDAI